MYEFALPPSFAPFSTYKLGATHGADLPFVFGTGEAAFTTADERRLSGVMMAQWVRFAATGAPDGFWPAWDAERESLVVFGPGVGVSATVPPGQVAVAARFPKDGCTFLDPFPATPPCSSSGAGGSTGGGAGAAPTSVSSGATAGTAARVRRLSAWRVWGGASTSVIAVAASPCLLALIVLSASSLDH